MCHLVGKGLRDLMESLVKVIKLLSSFDEPCGNKRCYLKKPIKKP